MSEFYYSDEHDCPCRGERYEIKPMIARCIYCDKELPIAAMEVLTFGLGGICQACVLDKVVGKEK